MNKLQAKKRIIDYFKRNLIKYRFLYEDSKPMMLDSSDTVYMCACIPDVIGGYIETSIRFKDEHLEEHFHESMNHILNFSVQQIADVYKAVISYVHGELDYYVATKVAIEHELMGKPILRIED